MNKLARQPPQRRKIRFVKNDGLCYKQCEPCMLGSSQGIQRGTPGVMPTCEQ
jgi:hypothetical protein